VLIQANIPNMPVLPKYEENSQNAPVANKNSAMKNWDFNCGAAFIIVIIFLNSFFMLILLDVCKATFSFRLFFWGDY
jgi:hypothetical protein